MGHIHIPHNTIYKVLLKLRFGGGEHEEKAEKVGTGELIQCWQGDWKMINGEEKYVLWCF